MQTDSVTQPRAARSLTEILAPVRPGLDEVERLLAEACRVPSIPILESILHSILGGPAKRLRPALALLVCELLDRRGTGPATLATACEVLHSATLVHDDIVDSADSRRGRPAVHVAWSGKLAVLAGDYLFASAADLVARLDRPRIVRQFADTIHRMSRSEFVQPGLNDGLQAARGQYLEKIGDKTASLLGLACDAASELVGVEIAEANALHAYGWNLGLAFQVYDDILDVSGVTADTGKPVGGDIRHGVLSLPVILYLERESNPRDIVHRVLEGDADEAMVAAALDALRVTGAVDAAREHARAFSALALNALRDLPQGPASGALAELVEYATDRRN